MRNNTFITAPPITTDKLPDGWKEEIKVKAYWLKQTQFRTSPYLGPSLRIVAYPAPNKIYYPDK